MSKELFMDAHEALVGEYMEAHPDADWTEAYEATAARAWERMRDNLGDRADEVRQRMKDARL